MKSLLLHDEFVVQHRAAKPILDPRRAYAAIWEEERDANGALAPTAVVFLTNKECPFRCVMCDLWVNTLDATVYNDVQVAWIEPFKATGLRVEVGGTNVFGVNPPICYTCTLNGYDAGTYDLPGAFFYVRANYKF